MGYWHLFLLRPPGRSEYSSVFFGGFPCFLPRLFVPPMLSFLVFLHTVCFFVLLRPFLAFIVSVISLFSSSSWVSFPLLICASEIFLKFSLFPLSIFSRFAFFPPWVPSRSAGRAGSFYLQHSCSMKQFRERPSFFFVVFSVYFFFFFSFFGFFFFFFFLLRLIFFIDSRVSFLLMLVYRSDPWVWSGFSPLVPSLLEFFVDSLGIVSHANRYGAYFSFPIPVSMPTARSLWSPLPSDRVSCILLSLIAYRVPEGILFQRLPSTNLHWWCCFHTFLIYVPVSCRKFPCSLIGGFWSLALFTIPLSSLWFRALAIFSNVWLLVPFIFPQFLLW